MTEREFVYADGRFYSVIDETATHTDVEGGGQAFITPAVGVWVMADLTTRLPGGQPVQILAADADRPSDTGESWQTRAIKAEMALAQQRTELGEAEGRARKATRTAQAVTRSRDADVRAAEAGRTEAERKRVRDLRVVAEKLAAIYGATAEFAALNGDPQYEGGYGSFCEVHDELWGDHDHDHIDAGRLLTFIADTLDLDHPAVRFPVPGPATIANACDIARFELARHGGTLDKVAEAILRMAAQPQRGATLREQVTWADAPPGTICGLCGHERGEHVSPSGGDCEARRTDDAAAASGETGRPCGCRGLTVELVGGRPAEELDNRTPLG